MAKHSNEDNETQFKLNLAKGLRNFGHVSHVESHSTATGFPDIEFCYHGTVVNIETKHSNEKHEIKIRPSQIRWAKQRLDAGGRVWFLARFDLKTMVAYILVHGQYAKELDKEYTTWVKYSSKTWINSIKYDELVGYLVFSKIN